jgi:hypothetical protein
MLYVCVSCFMYVFTDIKILLSTLDANIAVIILELKPERSTDGFVYCDL